MEDLKSVFFEYSDERLQETYELNKSRLAKWPTASAIPAPGQPRKRDLAKEATETICRVIEEIIEDRTKPAVLI